MWQFIKVLKWLMILIVSAVAVAVAGAGAYLYYSPLDLTYVYNIYRKGFPDARAKRIFVKLDKKSFSLNWFISEMRSQNKQIIGDWITDQFSAKSLTFSTKISDLLSFSFKPINIQVKNPYIEITQIKKNMKKKISYIDFELIMGFLANIKVDNGVLVANYSSGSKAKKYTLSKVAIDGEGDEGDSGLNINMVAAVNSTNNLKINKSKTSVKIFKQRGNLIAMGNIVCPSLPTKILLSLWPKSFKSNARSWSFANIKNGKATNLKNSFTIKLFRHKKKHKIWHLQDMSLKFNLAGAKIKYDKRLPILRIKSADVNVTSKEVKIDNLIGSVLNQKISNAQGVIKETNKIGELNLFLVARGKAQELLDGIIGEISPPVKNYLTINGGIEYNLNMKMPLKKDLKLVDMKILAKASMEDLSLIKVGNFNNFNGKFKDVSCTVKNNILLVSSDEGLIEGQVSDFVYKHYLTKNNHIEDVFANLSANISSNIAFYKKFGLNLQSVITGGGKNNINLVFSHDKVDVKIDYDLTQSSIEIPYLKVEKPKTLKAAVRGRLIFSGGDFKELTNLNLTVDNSWVMTASGIYNKGKGWSYFKSDCQLGKEKMFEFVVNTTTDGKQQIFLDTKGLDIKKVVKSLRKESLEQDTDNDKVDLINTNKECLYNITAKKFYSGDLYLGSEFEFIGTQKFVFTEINMKAYSRNNKLKKDKDIYFKLATFKAKREYELYMPEAGLLVQSMPQLSKVDIEGVKVYLINDLKEYKKGDDLLYKAGNLWKGSVSLNKLITPNFVNNLKSKREDVSDLNSEEKQIAEIEATLEKKGYKNKNIVFSNNHLKFNYSSEEDELTLKESIFSNSEIGISLEGMLNIGKNDLNLTGTFIPAYIINSLFGRIPIIGLFLTGKSKGIFAINFNIAGKFPDVKVSVNKASIIAPGILRILFPARKVNK